MFSLLAILPLLIALSEALSCSQQYQCSSVTNNYNYVACTNGQCTCRTDLGFTGSATTSSQCDCPAPYSVYWNGNNPYCIQYSDAVTYKTVTAQELTIMGKVQQLYASIVWPVAAGWANDIATGNFQGAYFDLFNANVFGVIDPLGSLQGFESVAEYFVGQVWTGISRIISTSIVSLYASGNTAFINIDLHFGSFLTPEDTTPYYSFNLTQTGTFTFDSNNTITHVDLVIRNVQIAVGPVNPNNAQYLTVLCQTILGAGCNSVTDPTGGAYTSFNDCMAYVSALDFGTWDNIRQNTTTCRVYHATLALLRPFVHCQHAGKTGGGKCVPHLASDYYADPLVRP